MSALFFVQQKGPRLEVLNPLCVEIIKLFHINLYEDFAIRNANASECKKAIPNN